MKLKLELDTLPIHTHKSSLPTFRALAVLALSAAVLTGCHKKTSGIDPSSLGPNDNLAAKTPVPTATLTADPTAIDLGQSVVLNWRTTDATSVTIDGIGQVNVNGTQSVSPSNSTNFHLTAKGDGGTAEANVRVTVRVAQTPVAAAPDTSSNVTDATFHAAVQDMYFDYDSYDLRADAQATAGAAASFMVAHPDLKILVGGYADERGSAEYNLALGENRANSAKTALVTAGVAPARIRVISYGKEKQFCTESNETCWQENRRAQFTIDR